MMTQSEFLDHIFGTFEKCLDIAKAKNQDYAGDHDPFNNFNRVQSFNICTVEQGILVRLTDKIARLSNLIASGKAPAVVDESVDDTILDAINYLAILRAYRESKPVDKVVVEVRAGVDGGIVETIDLTHPEWR